MPEQITLRGFVGKDPEAHQFDDGTVAARFRIATTTRRFDPDTSTWKDTHTNWYSVRCFRTLAMHVLASVRCGQPVVVTGKLQLHEWASETGPRTIAQVDAVAVGHDLGFGTANFARAGGGASRPATGQGTGEGRGLVVPELRGGERLGAATGVVIREEDEDDVFRPLCDAAAPVGAGPEASPEDTGGEGPGAGRETEDHETEEDLAPTPADTSAR